MTLTEFVLARIAEDAAAASECSYETPWTAEADPHDTAVARVSSSEFGELVVDMTVTEDAEHIARWDPARVLAECEVKRRIIEWASSWPLRPSRPSDQDAILRPLALPYAEHPDYREEWRL